MNHDVAEVNGSDPPMLPGSFLYEKEPGYEAREDLDSRPSHRPILNEASKLLHGYLYKRYATELHHLSQGHTISSALTRSFLFLFLMFVQPHLEHANPVWNPSQQIKASFIHWKEYRNLW